MADIPMQILGQDDLSAKHAVKEGAHDAVSKMVQYGTIALIVGMIGYVVLDKKTISKLKKRWL